VLGCDGKARSLVSGIMCDPIWQVTLRSSPQTFENTKKNTDINVQSLAPDDRGTRMMTNRSCEAQ